MTLVGSRFRYRPSARVLRIGGLLALAAFVVALVGTVALTAFVRRAALERLQAQVTVPVRIDKLNLNLFRGRARVTNLVIGGDDPSRPILTIPALDLGISYRDLLRGAARVKYVTVHAPRLFVERTGPESVNITQMLRPREGGEPAAVTVDQVEIRGGEITFVDRTQRPPFERTFTGVHLTAGRVSTVPQLRLTPTSFEVRIGIGQGSLTVTGATAPFGRPGGVELVARMERLDPGVFRAYLPLRAWVDLKGSFVTGEVHYVLVYQGDRATENGLTARVDTGAVAFRPPESPAPLVRFAGLTGREIRADFLTNRVHLGEILIREPHVQLERKADGTFTIMRLIEPDKLPVPASGPSSDARRPSTRQDIPASEPPREVAVTIGRGRIEAGTVEFIDHTTTPAVASTLHDVVLTLRDVGLGPGVPPGRVEGEARVEQGRIALAGTVEPRGPAARMRLTARGLRLDTFRGYLDAALPNASLRGGTGDARFDVVLAPRAGGTFALELGGTVEGRNLALVLAGTGEPVFRAQRLTVDLARLTPMAPFQADVARVDLVGGSLRVARDAGGNLDVARLWTSRAQPNGEPAASPNGRAEEAPAVTVRRVVVARSRVEFTDRTVTPAFTTALANLQAEVRQSPDDPKRMRLELRAILGEDAPLELGGWVTPFDAPMRAALKASVSDYELPRLNPYAVRYASHQIDRGRVTAKVSYTQTGSAFTAQNLITIKRIQVGEEVDSEFRQGVGVPLKLAVSLLEGPDGEIRLDVPVTGDEQGLHYQLGNVIRQAVRNTLVKVVASPFRMFGSMLTVGGRIGAVRIEPIEFRPGSLEPDDEASGRFAELIRFLKDKPRISLEIRGRATRNEVEPLKRELLREQLKSPPPGEDSPLIAVYRAAGGPATQTPPPNDDMERYVLDRMKITDEDLRKLADRRAHVIEETLVRRGVERGRLFSAAAERALVDGGLGRAEFEILY
ncbi:MAG TPA: DUF748 domain-containing protein [Methylomirabilota bacterium]|jgi:uncharacterized protein involved in outer membrane biogenesis|nr:DUF748 domain-containing protein [Methylomirabilota bacterium]